MGGCHVLGVPHQAEFNQIGITESQAGKDGIKLGVFMEFCPDANPFWRFEGTGYKQNTGTKGCQKEVC